MNNDGWIRRRGTKYAEERRTELIRRDLATGALALVEKVGKLGPHWYARVYYEVATPCVCDLHRRCGCSGSDIEIERGDRYVDVDEAKSWCTARRLHLGGRLNGQTWKPPMRLSIALSTLLRAMNEGDSLMLVRTKHATVGVRMIPANADGPMHGEHVQQINTTSLADALVKIERRRRA